MRMVTFMFDVSVGQMMAMLFAFVVPIRRTMVISITTIGRRTTVFVVGPTVFVRSIMSLCFMVSINFIATIRLVMPLV